MTNDLAIRFLRPVTGGDGAGLSWTFIRGQVVSLPAAQAQRFLADKSAIPASQPVGPPSPKDGLKVRVLSPLAGVESSQVYFYPTAHVVTLAPQRAHSLVRQGVAEWVNPPAPDPPVRVRFEASVAGLDVVGSMFDFQPGQVADVPRSRAKGWLASGVCVETTEAPRPAPVTAAYVEHVADLAAARARGGA